ncbi:MAG: hypothetical protein KDA85_14175, partial [Planctomycetaceae bacterium]|nr:hypothetical protein [Planctomycetaceae bacterium]
YRKDSFPGQYANLHAGGYPSALQIDADIFPRQCGGPLINLDGRAIGLNIARADRVVAYALPADHVLTIYEKLKQQATSQETSLQLAP